MFWGMVFCFLQFKGITDIYDSNYVLLRYSGSQNAAIISLPETNGREQENDPICSLKDVNLSRLAVVVLVLL